MKKLLVLFMLLCCSCAALEERIDHPPSAADVDSAIAQAEKDLQLVEATLAVARVHGADLCRRFPVTCAVLADYLSSAEEAVDTAKLAIHEYKAGRVEVEVLARAISQAADFVQGYMKTIVRESKQTAKGARGPSKSGFSPQWYAHNGALLEHWRSLGMR